MSYSMFNRLFSTLCIVLASGLAFAATPPGLINYQGVLRAADDTPLDGPYPMTFRFYDDDDPAPPENEILIDDHAAILVSRGMFNVALGSGAVFDGPGPGTYTNLAEVFRDYEPVFLQVIVNGEPLYPRVHVVAAAYAMNSGHLAGLPPEHFLDTTTFGQTKFGELYVDTTAFTASTAFHAIGQAGGGFFSNAAGTAQANLANGDIGVLAYGTNSGGQFSDSLNTGRVTLGNSGFGLYAYGTNYGALVQDQDDDGYVYLGNGDYGVNAYGNAAGSFNQDPIGVDASTAELAGGGVGIDAGGSRHGGYFTDMDDSAYTYVARGDRGLEAYGNGAGGYFENTTSGGNAYVAQTDAGIRAYGSGFGGYFEDTDNTGKAWLGKGDRGLEAEGSEMGAFIRNTILNSRAEIATDRGISGYGIDAGGYFEDTDDSGWAYVAKGGYGIWGVGDFGGGSFFDFDGAGWADVARDSYKITGNGGVSFVQNHPEKPERVIVYTAPEGDEVATYTRGTARLNGGEARVPLGDTFKWVTNPDIGLTVQVTPVGAWSDLYVAQKSTRELVVRSRAGAPDATFDYIVHGLRIGFEEASVVQEKDREAYIPSMASHRERFEKQPELRAFNALERFKAMRPDARAALDLSASQALRDAIIEFDPAVHRVSRPEKPPHGDTAEHVDAGSPVDTARPQARARSRGTSSVVAALPVNDEGNARARSLRPALHDPTHSVPVSRPVVAGDVLVMDPDRPGAMKPGDSTADPKVVGIVVAAGDDPVSVPADASDMDRAPVALSGITLCKADAGYGSILPGDLLTTSPTPGHAMRAVDPVMGTILGKALEPLDVGTGLIRVVVMMR